MNPNDELHVIFGAGQVGTELARELAARGRRVRVVSRGGAAPGLPDGVEAVRADVADAEAAREAARGAAVVYGTAQPPYTRWPELFPPIQAGLIAAAAAADAKLVVAENLYMYGRHRGPLTEELPYAATGRKGRTRAAMAEALMAAHAAGTVRATAGRASDFYGPGVLASSVGETVFGRAVAGKAAQALGDPDAPHTYTYVRDFARALVTLGERDEALGRAWHVPNAPTLSTREFVALVYEELGARPKLRVAPRPLVSALALVNPMMREFKEMLYEFEEPFVVDHAAFERAFGPFAPTPHREAIRETVAWFRAHGEPGGAPSERARRAEA